MEIAQETNAKCTYCDKKFSKTADSPYGNYCSEKCKTKAKKVDSNRKPNATCAQCGKPFYAKIHKGRRSQYCSHDCFNTSHRETRECLRCGKTFTTEKSNPKQHCTIQCANLDLKSKETTTRICPNCKQQFHTHTKKRFCSPRCAGQAKDRRQMRICDYCKKDFYPPKGLYEKKYCSAECALKAQDTKVTLICPNCSKEFRVSPCFVGIRKYCSNECANTVRPPYRNFLTKIKDGIRTAIEAKTEKALQSSGISYEWEKRFGRYWVDFYLPEYNIAIECDEPYWHDQGRDAQKDKYLLSKYHVRVFRFTTQQINSNIEELIADILTHLTPISS